MRKETIDTGILIILSNDDNEWTSNENEKVDQF